MRSAKQRTRSKRFYTLLNIFLYRYSKKINPEWVSDLSAFGALMGIFLVIYALLLLTAGGAA